MEIVSRAQRGANREWIRLRKAFLLRPLFPELWRTRRRDRQRQPDDGEFICGSLVFLCGFA
jgi:hypothetical protein